MFARGWSPSDTQRRAFSLVVGLLLVLNPFLAQQFDLGGPRYEYTAAPVEPAGDSLDFAEDTRTPYGTDLRGVDCYLLDRPWTCYLEERAAVNGSVTVTTDRAYDRPRAEFVHLEGGFYRRTATDIEDTGRVEYERVDAQTVLSAVSVTRARAPDPFQRAVREGTATSRHEYEAARFVRDGSNYYIVGPVGSDRGIDDRWTLSFVGTVLGLLVLRRGYRQSLVGDE
jgi:hypothetical protein